MTWICTVSHPVIEEPRDTATIQTELRSTKLTAFDDWHLLAQPLLDFKHRYFHASSTHSAEETAISTIAEDHWPSFSVFLDAAD